jgi:hypothetical protein
MSGTRHEQAIGNRQHCKLMVLPHKEYQVDQMDEKPHQEPEAVISCNTIEKEGIVTLQTRNKFEFKQLYNQQIQTTTVLRGTQEAPILIDITDDDDRTSNVLTDSETVVVAKFDLPIFALNGMCIIGIIQIYIKDNYPGWLSIFYTTVLTILSYTIFQLYQNIIENKGSKKIIPTRHVKNEGGM